MNTKTIYAFLAVLMLYYILLGILMSYTVDSGEGNVTSSVSQHYVSSSGKIT